MSTFSTTPGSSIEVASTRSHRSGAAQPTSLVSAYAQLTKARLSALVLVTTAVGFVMAWPVEILPLDWPLLAWTIIGTAMCAGAANAFNEIIERRRDALMHRTQRRPLPTGRIGMTHALVFALALTYIGVSILAVKVNMTAAGLALLTIVLYVVAYTPLKTRSSLNTLVGAICGAIPPMIGWVGASAGEIEAGAWVLAAILFVWQLPHFMALAWLYRDDYRRGGYAMLPVIDRDGRLTCRVVVLTSLALLPVALAATMAGMAGWLYAAGSLLLGVWMLWLATRLHDTRSDASARVVFIASVTYLPLLLVLMVVDRGSVRQVDSPADPTRIAHIAPLAPTTSGVIID
jgi:protoheme IX farnesyltransferase